MTQKNNIKLDRIWDNSTERKTEPLMFTLKKERLKINKYKTKKARKRVTMYPIIGKKRRKKQKLEEYIKTAKIW